MSAVSGAKNKAQKKKAIYRMMALVIVCVMAVSLILASVLTNFY